MESYPLARELVLAGGGHSHVILLRMLAMNPIPGLRTTLVSPDTRTPYSGMLPGLIAGHYQEDEVYIDLVPLCRFAGAEFIQAGATGLDTGRQLLEIAGRPPVHYDLLSLDIGSTPHLPSAVSSNAVVPVKPISSFLTRWQAFLERFEKGAIKEIGFVGAGAGGVELCLAVHHYLQSRFPGSDCRTNLFTDGKTLLPEFDASVRVRFEKIFAERHIRIHRDFHAVSTEESHLASEDGRLVPLDEVFWVTQAGAQQWPAAAGLAVDADGFIRVRDTLQVENQDNVFAVGDCANMINFTRPKAGVYAVRQGKPLYRNIRNLLLNKQPRPFRPQSRFLSLITTGGKHAVASRNGFSTAGDWVWRWKDWIDQRFMDQFTILPAMDTAPVNSLQEEFDSQMHCGGCGSKVAADLLADTLSELLGDDAPSDDAVSVDIPAGKQLLQTVDHFRGFVNDTYLQARVAVCHATSDIYACGGVPLSVLASLTLPFGKPDVTRSILRQLMHGTLDQLEIEGAKLAGGHTSEGAELSIGFTVNGILDPDAAWSKQGARVGDVLLLTKPVGTGAIFAADMQHRASGQWVAAALEQMVCSNRQAAEIGRQYSIHACTDITGFGLAGHSLEMASTEVGIEIDLDALPVLAGANECIDNLGITSSLHEANRRSSGLDALPGRAEILFDPQTSGGLLFCLPAEEGNAMLEALRKAGYSQAALIGRAVAGSGLNVIP